jgi:hypothetical protein
MLLGDLEVARRLYREEGKKPHDLDDLPIGVAIAAINQLIEKDPDWHFRSEVDDDKRKKKIIYQIFQDSYEIREKAVQEVLKKHVFGSDTVSPKDAIRQVKVKHKREIERER